MKAPWRHAVDKSGFAVLQDILPETAMATLIEHLGDSRLRRSKAGIRHALGFEAVAAVARDHTLMEVAREVLGSETIPFRATVFDKSPVSNWLVVWHQDTALPLRKRREELGWGPWSVKDGINYAHAPARALEKIVALRVHLDDSTLENGPLRVLPGTHTLGVLTDDEIHSLSQKTPMIDCLVPKGGVLAMRPLTVHSSSKSSVELPRRVLHIEYANSLFIDDGMELAIV